MITRRSVVGFLLAAPAIVRPSVLMRCTGTRLPPDYGFDEFRVRIIESIAEAASIPVEYLDPSRMISPEEVAAAAEYFRYFDAARILVASV